MQSSKIGAWKCHPDRYTMPPVICRSPVTEATADGKKAIVDPERARPLSPPLPPAASRGTKATCGPLFQSTSLSGFRPGKLDSSSEGGTHTPTKETKCVGHRPSGWK